MDDNIRYIVDSINTKDERIITRLIRIILIIIVCWLLSVAALVWYISLPVDEYSVEQNDNNGGYNQVIGGDYNGLSESDLQETGGEE